MSGPRPAAVKTVGQSNLLFTPGGKHPATKQPTDFSTSELIKSFLIKVILWKLFCLWDECCLGFLEL